VRNTITLFNCAKQAGVERVVHISVTNSSEQSHLEYFRGKATVEKALQESGISYSILRPAIFFGKDDILINNIAWILRRFTLMTLQSWQSSRERTERTQSLTPLALKHSRIKVSYKKLARPSERGDRLYLSRRQLVTSLEA
jgi:NADH dehydrogenase